MENRSLLRVEKQPWLLLQGSDGTSAPRSGESSGLSGTGCSMWRIAAGTNPSVPGCPHQGTSAFRGTVSSKGVFLLAVVPVQLLQSLSDSDLEGEKNPNKTKVESVVV